MANPFAEELQRRQNPFQAEMQRRQPQMNMAGMPIPSPASLQNLKDEDFSAIGRAAVTRIFDAVANVPELIHDFSPTNVMTLPKFVRDQRNLNVPTGKEAVAALDAMLQTPRAMMTNGEPIGTRMEQSLERGEQLAEANPIATGAGNVAGDALSLAAGRVPLARTAPLRFLREGARPEIFFGAASKSITPTKLRLLNRFVQSPTMTTLARGAGRSAEAGFEGAALAALHGGDPLQTAAYAAGGQTLGSLLIGGTTLRNPKTLPLRAAALFSTIQLTKDFIPGGRDRSLESIEEAFSAIKWGILMGAAARLAGAGRRGEQVLDKAMPKLAEAVNSLPRGATISIIEQWQNDESGAIEAVLRKLSVNPQAFNANQRARLERAINSGKLDSEIDKLMEVQSFREAMGDTQ